MRPARDAVAQRGVPRASVAVVASVSDTARWAAIYRARESARDDALFDDPYAARLAGDRGEAIAARAPRQTRSGWPVVARTVAIDNLTRAAIAAGCDRVLCLAAGLDARPYRLALPASLIWVEADLPAIIEEKQRALAGEAPNCRLIREPVDLADASARAAFLDRALGGARKALVIAEGLLMYLDEAVVTALARDLARPEVAWWVSDIVSPATLSMTMKAMKADLANAPMRFAPSDGVAFFEALGWKTVDIVSVFDEAARLGRLPWLFRLLARLPLPAPNPRRLGGEHWSAVARFERQAGGTASRDAQNG